MLMETMKEEPSATELHKSGQLNPDRKIKEGFANEAASSELNSKACEVDQKGNGTVSIRQGQHHTQDLAKKENTISSGI